VFQTLSNRRRRYVLHYLLQRESAVQFRRLTEHVTAWEHGVPVEAVTHTQRKRVYTALRQTHLPKMAADGVIEYDRQRGLVEPTDAVDEFEIYLDIVAGENIPWSRFYLGVSVLSAALTALVVLELPPFSLFAGGSWALVVCAGFVATSIAHVRADRNRRIGRDGPPPECHTLSADNLSASEVASAPTHVGSEKRRADQ
jgi:hypothetical protein